MDDITKKDIGEFVGRWRRASAPLEDQRMEELSRLSDEQARRMTVDLFGLWRPTEYDDFGAELVEQQRVFRLSRDRRQGQP